MLAGRAAIMNLTRRGRISAGGATRLLRHRRRLVCGRAAARRRRRGATGADGSRRGHRRSVGSAIPLGGNAFYRWTWSTAPSCSTSRSQRWGKPQRSHRPCDACGSSAGPRRADGLLVADLSSLWAGPLCGQLLARAGAVVVKVESPSRPDGTRRGEPAFFDWMNAGKLSYCVDFDSDSDALRRLLDAADIVIEGSRPAALRRRGLSAEDLPGRTGSNLVAYQRLSRPARPAGVRGRRRGRRRTGRRCRRRAGVLRRRDRGPAERAGGGARGGGVAAPRWR